MEIFSPKNRTIIEEQLRTLGFDNYSDIVNGATKSTDPPFSQKEIVEMQESRGDPDGIDYIFSLRKSTSDTGWQFERIEGYFVMDTLRETHLGMICVGKSYDREDGPFPTKDRIRQDVLEQLRIEKIRDRLCVDHNLNREFERLGFPDLEEMLFKADHKNHEKGVYVGADTELLKKMEIIPSPLGNGKDRMEFAFFIVIPPNGKPPYLERVHASLDKEAPNRDDIKKISETIFWRQNGPLPTKEQMFFFVPAAMKERLQRVEDGKDPPVEGIRLAQSISNAIKNAKGRADSVKRKKSHGP